jgi:peptidoglycan/xylan/chitin deacetylase (PgdA/CDA1 family)
MNKVIITTSWDDGHPLDLKLAKLLKRYNIPATFYIPSENRARKTLTPDQIREIAKDFDIGGHTYSHVNLTELPKGKAYEEIIKSKEYLEEIIGKEIQFFCYPWGAYNKEVINIVKKAGFEGAGTVKLLEIKLSPLFEMGTTIHVGEGGYSHFKNFLMHSKVLPNARMPVYLLARNLLFKDWFETAVDSLNFVVKNGGVFHLWGHSWEIDRNNDWEKLKLIFERISEVSKNKKVLLMNNTKLIQYLKDESHVICLGGIF